MANVYMVATSWTLPWWERPGPLTRRFAGGLLRERGVHGARQRSRCGCRRRAASGSSRSRSRAARRGRRSRANRPRRDGRTRAAPHAGGSDGPSEKPSPNCSGNADARGRSRRTRSASRAATVPADSTRWPSTSPTVAAYSRAIACADAMPFDDGSSGACSCACVPHLVVVEEVRRPGERIAGHRAGRGERIHQLADGGSSGGVGGTQRRDARLLGLGQADPPVEPERCRDLLGEEPADRPAGDAAHDLAGHPAVGPHVVARRRLVPVPARRLRGELLDDRVPRERRARA